MVMPGMWLIYLNMKSLLVVNFILAHPDKPSYLEDIEEKKDLYYLHTMKTRLLINLEVSFLNLA